MGGGEGEGKDGKNIDGNPEGKVTVEVDGKEYELPSTLDKHGERNKGETDKELVREIIKVKVQQAKEQSDRHQGNMPGNLEELIHKLLSHKTLTWRNLLRSFRGNAEFHDWIPSRQRKNKRFDHLFGNRVETSANILVAIDTSGSVSNEEIAKFFTEIKIMKQCGVSITIVECDCDIGNVYEYTNRIPKSVTGRGGTSFIPVFDFIKDGIYKRGNKEFKLKKKPDGVVYLTDGYGSFPNPKDVYNKVLWIIVKDSGFDVTSIDKKVGIGVVMRD